MCRVQSFESSSLKSRAVDDGASRVGRSIRAIGARAEHDDPIEAVDFDRRGQSKFLVAPAQSIAATPNRACAAENYTSRTTKRRVVPRNLFSERSVRRRDRPAFTFDSARKNHRMIAQSLGLALRR